MLKVISLDMDGTLVRSDFVDAVWLEGIPALYAEQRGLPLAEAKKMVFQAYEAVGPQQKEWYLPAYWFDYLKIRGDWRQLMEACRHKVCLFPETRGVLKRLSEKYSLIVVSNAPQEFIDVELGEFKGSFQHIFSCVSHFDRVKKDATVFNDICRRIGVSPREVCHAGDNYQFDYVAPSSAGMNACFVDRGGNGNAQGMPDPPASGTAASATAGTTGSPTAGTTGFPTVGTTGFPACRPFTVKDLVEFEARLPEFCRA